MKANSGDSAPWDNLNYTYELSIPTIGYGAYHHSTADGGTGTGQYGNTLVETDVGDEAGSVIVERYGGDGTGAGDEAGVDMNPYGYPWDNGDGEGYWP